jgi:chorismate mutase
MDEHRAAIDSIDKQLLMLLERRTTLAARLGRIKHSKGLPIEQIGRETAIRRAAYDHARMLQRIDIDMFYDAVFSISKRYQGYQQAAPATV